MGDVDVEGDQTGECYGFSSLFFFNIGPSPENARAEVGVSSRDIVEDQNRELISLGRVFLGHYGAQVGQERQHALRLLSWYRRPAYAEVGKATSTAWLWQLEGEAWFTGVQW